MSNLLRLSEIFDASVIISTYNGALKISGLLDALLQQTNQNFEVVVVIDGSTDNTAEIVEAYVRRFKSCRVLTQPNLGRSRVRNRGASACRSEVLVFYDDDMLPAPDSVERHIKAHALAQDVLITGNQVEAVSEHKTDIQNYKATRVEAWMSKYVDPITRLSHGNLFFSAANCSMTRSTFERLKGFDERLSDAEDYHLAHRALSMGFSVFLYKENRAIHRDNITARSYVKRQREYAMSHLVLAQLFPQAFPPTVRPANWFKHSAYRIFALREWIKWIDSDGLRFLPALVRYRLYDVVLHALSVEYPNVRI